MSSSFHPLVTVIIPTFNRRDTIIRCVQSVLEQSYKYVEIIVIDDGSTDETLSALRREFGDAVKTIWQENQGQGAATKIGIQESKGDLIAFLDSDDYWVPNKLQLQVAFLNDHPALVAVYTDAEEYTEPGVEHKSYIELHNLLRNPDKLMEAMVKLCIPLRSTVVVRKDFLVRNNIRPDPIAQGKDDVQVFMEIVGHGGKFGFIDEVSTYRFMHDSNMSGDHFKKFFKRIATFENLLQRLPHLPREWKCQVERALSDSLFRVGEHYWGTLEIKQARHYFLRALSVKKSNMRALRGLAYSFIPQPIVSKIRSWV